MKSNYKKKFKNFKIFFMFLTFFILLFFLVFNVTRGSLSKGNVAHEILIFSKQPFLIRGFHEHTIDNIPIFITNFFKSFFITTSEKIQQITLNIKFKDYQKILTNIDEGNSLPYNISYITHKDSVKGAVVFNNQKYKAKIRIKGDRGDHWNRSKTHSLNIDLKKGKTINSMESFSIMKFASRQYPALQILSGVMSRMGIIVQKYDAYDVVLNGDNWGVMYAEEEISPSFQEIRNLKEVPIIRYSNKDHLKLHAEYGSFNQSFYDLGEILYKRKNIDINNKKKYTKNNDDTSINKNIINLHQSINYYSQFYENFNFNHEQIIRFFDIKQFSQVFASEIIFGEFHAAEITNLLLYYNIFEGLIKPIPTDFDACFYYKKDCEYKSTEEFKKKSIPEIYYLFIENKLFFNEFKKALSLIKNDLSNINNDLNKLCKNFLTSECRKNFSLTQIKNNIDFIEKNSSKIFEILIENKKEFIIKNNNTIRTAKINLSLDNELNNYIIKNFEKFNTIRVFKNGNIEISNLSPINIAVKTVNFYQKSQNKKIICSSYNSNKSIDKFASYSFQVNNLNKNCPEKDLFFKIEYTANNKIYTSEGFAIPNHFNKKKFLNNLKDIPLPDSLATLKKQTFYIKKGTYKINEPIIIPEGYNLKIEMGTTLNFSENSFILLLGGDIVLDGNVKNTIKLQAQDKNWGGIFVRNSSNSRISYSVIDKTNFFNDYNNMFFLTGGINFYKSNVIINNTIIKNSDAEDSINFTNSNFLIKNSEFINSKSDAIDSDYSKGSVENSSFDKIYGDAIDISGSKINIINIKINNTKDKGLSAGENSIANIQKSKIENAQIAIAAKDGTKVSGDDVEFLNNAQDLAAYLKKPMYLKSGEIYLRNLKDIDLKILKDKNGIVNLNNINIEQINYNYSSNAK